MDIIQFISNDHKKMREELYAMKRSSSQDDLKTLLEKHIAHCEIHEALEGKILKLLETIPDPEGDLDKALLLFQQDHNTLWTLLSEIRESNRRNFFSFTRQLFFNYCAIFESHMAVEEKYLLPMAANILRNTDLEDLGHRAEDFYHRFYPSYTSQHLA